MKTIRIGSGAGYAGDRIEPALDLICSGNLDYIILNVWRNGPSLWRSRES